MHIGKLYQEKCCKFMAVGMVNIGKLPGMHSNEGHIVVSA
jgi:hypothetical protein